MGQLDKTQAHLAPKTPTLEPQPSEIQFVSIFVRYAQSSERITAYQVVIFSLMEEDVLGKSQYTLLHFKAGTNCC